MTLSVQALYYTQQWRCSVFLKRVIVNCWHNSSILVANGSFLLTLLAPIKMHLFQLKPNTTINVASVSQNFTEPTIASNFDSTGLQ